MSDGAEHSLVMPFVTVASKGGPHDDESFTCGFVCGAYDHELSERRLAAAVRTVQTSVVAQLDLIAMRHGYRLDDLNDDPEHEPVEGWSTIGLTRIDAEEVPR